MVANTHDKVNDINEKVITCPIWICDALHILWFRLTILLWFDSRLLVAYCFCSDMWLWNHLRQVPRIPWRHRFSMIYNEQLCQQPLRNALMHFALIRGIDVRPDVEMDRNLVAGTFDFCQWNILQLSMSVIWFQRILEMEDALSYEILYLACILYCNSLANYELNGIVFVEFSHVN